MKSSNHYFDDTSTLNHDRKELSFRFFDKTFHFTTDAGVFSRSQVDKGSLTLLEVLAQKSLSGSILDLGCGYGLIGIILAKLFPETRLSASEINPRAVELAKKNVKANGLSYPVFHSDGFDQLKNDHYDHIVLNPPIRAGKAVIYDLFQGSYDHLKEGGRLWIVMKKKHGLQSAYRFLSGLFVEVEKVDKKRDYVVLSCIKKDSH